MKIRYFERLDLSLAEVLEKSGAEETHTISDHHTHKSNTLYRYLGNAGFGFVYITKCGKDNLKTYYRIDCPRYAIFDREKCIINRYINTIDNSACRFLQKDRYELLIAWWDEETNEVIYI